MDTSAGKTDRCHFGMELSGVHNWLLGSFPAWARLDSPAGASGSFVRYSAEPTWPRLHPGRNRFAAVAPVVFVGEELKHRVAGCHREVQGIARWEHSSLPVVAPAAFGSRYSVNRFAWEVFAPSPLACLMA